MEVILGKTAGFCYGVERAVNGCIKTLNEFKDVYCLGEIVHNRQVNLDLKQKGIKFIENIEQAPNNSKVIIRAHGINKEIYEIAKNKNIELFDYTCPNVIKVHNIAKSYAKEGYYILLTCSKKNHPEIIGTKSFCGENYVLIENQNDLEDALKSIKNNKIKKAVLISQTTFGIKRFKEIQDILAENLPEECEFKVENTICYATNARQEETEKISKKVDKMIIIGGKNSSNTQKLYDIALQNCSNSICIETKDDIKNEDLININKIGVMAGASTPKNVINSIIEKYNILGSD